MTIRRIGVGPFVVMVGSWMVKEIAEHLRRTPIKRSLRLKRDFVKMRISEK
jgi:hypothetical protein